MERRYKRIISLVLMISFLILIGIRMSSGVPQETDAPVPGQMEVHFLDVGQGDSTLIVCDGHAMLIDAADDTQGTRIQEYLRKQKVDRLDYLVLTHPDFDHIGGAPAVITKFKIDQVFMSNFEKDNKTYRKLIQALDDKRLEPVTPAVGSQYMLGSATITILGPNREYDDPNDASVALLIQNGNDRFLFTGDAEEDAELDILDTGMDVSADVYQAGHHGSRTSTSESFFGAVRPTYAVISCAEGNTYGHPHAATLNTFRMNGVQVFRTDEQGTIVAVSDGQTITFNVPASETWQAGEPTGSQAQSKGTGGKGSSSGGKGAQQGTDQAAGGTVTYILNTSSKKFHLPTCDQLPTNNRKDTNESRESLIEQGYSPCGGCKP